MPDGKFPLLVHYAIALSNAAIDRDGTVPPALFYLDAKRQVGMGSVADLFEDDIASTA